MATWTLLPPPPTLLVVVLPLPLVVVVADEAVIEVVAEVPPHPTRTKVSAVKNSIVAAKAKMPAGMRDRCENVITCSSGRWSTGFLTLKRDIRHLAPTASARGARAWRHHEARCRMEVEARFSCS